MRENVSFLFFCFRNVKKFTKEILKKFTKEILKKFTIFLEEKLKNIFFRKKMYLFFFEFFVFFDIFSHFSGSEKKLKFLCFFLKSKISNIFELKFWHENLFIFDENVFGAFYRLLLRLKIFLCFWDSCPCSGPIWKKKLKIWKKIPKMFNFWNFICGSAAENSIKNILLPKIITKNILSKIRPLHH